MNYTELVNLVEATVEDSIDATVMEQLVRKAERQIFVASDMPAMRQNKKTNLTTSNPYLTLPDGFLYPYSLAVVVSEDYHYLLNKDSNFIREAYPNESTSGIPKHYAIFDDDTCLIAPTPDDDYVVELHYAAYPESIVDAGESWLGENFDNVLTDGVLLELSRFQKAEQDVEAMYQSRYEISLKLFKTVVDGKLRRDTYRSSQQRVLDK